MGYAPYPVAEKRRHRRQWRYYETPAGNKPVKKFIDGLSDADAAEVFAGMRDVANVGLSVARHLRGDIYEVRVDGENLAFRVCSHRKADSSRYSSRSKALPTQKTPPQAIRLAEGVSDWRSRGKALKRKGKQSSTRNR